MKFKHGEHEIDMDEGTGTFHFNIDGEARTSTSLVGAKRIIDTAAKKKFEPFQALVLGYNDPGFNVVKVVGKKAAPKSKWHTYAPMWITTRDKVAQVYADTPENRAALSAAWELGEANRKANKAALEAIPVLLPGDSK